MIATLIVIFAIKMTFFCYKKHFCHKKQAITLSFNIDSMFSFLSASLQVDLDLSLYDSYLHC